ncbi:MAG: hypothetical protein ACETWG_05700 [Candidatus Neomarinimicrobiota bacterium]
MTKRKNNPSQLGLPIGSDLVGLDQRLAKAFSLALKHPHKSRQQIADELSARLNKRITIHMLDNYASTQHSHQPPPDVIAALYASTGNPVVIETLCESLGILPITGKDITYLQLARAKIARQRLDREIQDLEERLR